MPRCYCRTGVLQDPITGICPNLPSKFLLYGRIINDNLSQIAMASLETDMGVSVPLPFQIPGPGTHYVAYDIRSRKVYWDETNPPAIKSAPIDASSPPEPEVVIGTDIRDVSGIAIDPHSRNVYWSDRALDRIEVVSISSTTPRDTDGRTPRKVIVSGNIHHPQSLALDLENGYIYWVDLDSNKPRIERARLDGSEREKLFSSPNFFPTYLAVNPATGFVYWTDSNDSDGDINSNYTLHHGMDGFNVNAHHVHGLGIIENDIYWTDGQHGTVGMATIMEDNIFRRNQRFVENVVGVQGLVAVDTDAHIPGNECALNNPDFMCSHICISINQTTVCKCPDGLQFRDGSVERCTEPSGFSVVALTPKDDISFIEVYSRDVQIDHEDWDFAKPPIEQEIISMAIHVHDNASCDVYFIDANDQLIYRRSISDVKRVQSTDFIVSEATPIITCCLSTPRDLAVDWLGRNLYWTDPSRGVIEVSLLSGMSRRVLYSDLDRPLLIVLDPRRGNIYFTQADATMIYTLKMDGSSSSISNICNHGNCTVSNNQNTGGIISMSIDFDPTVQFQDRLVWSYQSETRTIIGSYDLSDLNMAPVSIAISEVNRPYSHSVYFNNTLYFAENGHGISSKDVDSTLQIVNDGTSNFHSFYISHHLTQPGYHECTAGELCTGHSPLCLIRDHIYGTCQCSLTSFKWIKTNGVYGFTQESCAEAKSFIIWATRTDIYFYPLPSDITNERMTSKPNILSRGSHGDVIAVTYDPKTRDVIWVEDGTLLIHSVSVDGNGTKTLGRFPDRVSLESMSLDWIGGQVLFTESSGFQIEAAGVRTVGNGTLTVGSVVSSYLIEGGRGVVSPKKPQGVVFDAEKRTILWHEEGSHILGKILGTEATPTILLEETGTRSIAYLTFDPSNNYVYWWNEREEVIEGFRHRVTVETGVMETAQESDVTTLVSGVREIGGLSANTIKNPYLSNLIFWYDEDKNSFYYCNVTRKLEEADFDCRQRQLSWFPGNGKSIISMMSFDEMRVSSIQTTYNCRSDAIQCDYLCLENQGTAKCACPLFRAPVPENESKCAEISCFEFHSSCDDELECVPNSYFCDRIDHCINGFDERNCTDCPVGSFPCGPGDEGRCYQNSSRCDDTLDCLKSRSDEEVCCQGSEFGCYTIQSGYYQCFQDQLRCDGDQICQNYSVPDDCKPTTQPPTSNPNSSGPANEVTIGTVTATCAILALVLMVIILYISIRCVTKQKKQQTFHFPSKEGSSPPPRSDVSSIYSVMSSLGTQSTIFNSGSPHPDPFVVKTAPFNHERSTHISNPPPSLITTARRQSQLLDTADLESQADMCRAPPPSVDWENVSALSISASQGGGLRLANTAGGAVYHHNHHQRPAPSRVARHHPQAENPFNYHGVGFRGNARHLYHHHGNGHPYGGGGSATTSVVSGNTRQPLSGGDPHYPPIALNNFRANGRGMVAPSVYHSDLPNYEEAETETVFSQSTIQTENGSHFPFDDRTPPGRPPSPATITEYSERDLQRVPPLTPTSEYSIEDERESEGSLHIQEHQV